ncbi:MAG: nucleotidyltransferase family protein [Deltaproteobacteria bacterium]|nr:nucleotidyltransferase family protein [Deltaproteobacteria bacterium]MBW1737324.1 nucleotidyltransferase family protein [Deltaproteobacteria bacterium]MBW1910191.1 nucleotidyltransferase family protein [Deltaproteobacteria bacterium]MBW2032873.1 nucleotidyltransferase family protein [Deltaproteobacteria bacterium]MBW2114701.1 nucleotidyltransferase family protein [Deltaproteobacteria bacterium]
MIVNQNMNLTREEKLLRLIAAQRLESTQAAAIRREVNNGLEWYRLINIALYNGLASLLYRHLKDLELFPLAPEWFEEALEKVYNKTVFHNLRILRFLNDLGQILKKENIPVIILQGAALLMSVYDDPGVRPMEDIDLMVRPDHRRRLQRIFQEMGFSSDSIYPDTYRKGIIYIDIHVDILSSERIHARKWVMNTGPEDIWNSALPLMDKSIPLYRLTPFDNLIALSNHLLKHNLERLKWFMDIREIILAESGTFDWDRFVFRCRESGSDRCVLYILLLARRLLGLEVPEIIFDSFGRKRLSSIEKTILRLRLKNKDVGRLFQVLWLFQINKKSEQFRFIIENIFPRKEIMNQIFVSSPRVPPSYTLRFFNILSHGLYDIFSAFRHIIFSRLPRL